MKNSNIGVKAAVATMVMIIGGNALSFISSPPNPDKEIVKTMPAFSDISAEDRDFTEKLYLNNIISGKSDTLLGIDDNITASELAYAAVGLYEKQNNILNSYTEYEADNTEYIEKAVEYEVWLPTDKSASDNITRAEAAEVFASFAADIEPVKDYMGYIGMENNKYAQSAITLYNRGIALDKNINTAYSTEHLLTKGEMVKLINMISNPDLRLDEFMTDYVKMETMLKDMMSKYQGDWSLYFEDYESGNVISINSHQVYSASLIKLFVTQSIYTRIDKGSLQETEHIQNLLYKMITVSDNDAWRELARILGNGSYMNGMASVTDVAKDAGFNDTGQFMQGGRQNYNFTSVNDCGVYMRKVLDGEIVAPEYSEKILKLLKQQQIKVKIPSGIPDGITVANKTGELDYIQGDAAIVYAPSGTYILAVIGDSLENAGLAQEQIRELSSAVYQYLNN